MFIYYLYTFAETKMFNMSIAIIILSIFLPPVAVAMVHGIGKAFILNIVLTLLGGLPGMIHALWVNGKG